MGLCSTKQSQIEKNYVKIPTNKQKCIEQKDHPIETPPQEHLNSKLNQILKIMQELNRELDQMGDEFSLVSDHFLQIKNQIPHQQ